MGDFKVKHTSALEFRKESVNRDVVNEIFKHENPKEFLKEVHHEELRAVASAAGRYVVKGATKKGWQTLQKTALVGAPEAASEMERGAERVLKETDPATILHHKRQIAWAKRHFTLRGRSQAYLAKMRGKQAEAEKKVAKAHKKMDKTAAKQNKKLAQGKHVKRLERKNARLGRKMKKQAIKGLKFAGNENFFLGRLRARNKKVAKFLSKGLLRMSVKVAAVALCGFLACGVFLNGISSAAAAITSFGANNRPQSSDLTADEQIMWNLLQHAGFKNSQIAAVIGNGYAESGNNPASYAIMDGLFNYPYERAGGIWQFTDCGQSPSNLVSRELTDFTAFANKNGKPWQDTACQTTWMLQSYQSRWINRSGYYDTAVPAYAGTDISFSAWQALPADDWGRATYMWMAAYEGPSAAVCNWTTRYQHAQAVYQYITDGGGGGPTTDAERRIVEATNQVPSPGAGKCAEWVSRVYQQAGFGYPGGNACDMYWKWCTSSDKSALKPGMIVAVPSHPLTPDGRIYGHVGIYIGNGLVKDNVGYIATTSLSQWIQGYGSLYQVKWGFAGNVE